LKVALHPERCHDVSHLILTAKAVCIMKNMVVEERPPSIAHKLRRDGDDVVIGGQGGAGVGNSDAARAAAANCGDGTSNGRIWNGGNVGASGGGCASGGGGGGGGGGDGGGGDAGGAEKGHGMAAMESVPTMRARTVALEMRTLATVPPATLVADNFRLCHNERAVDGRLTVFQPNLCFNSTSTCFFPAVSFSTSFAGSRRRTEQLVST